MSKFKSDWAVEECYDGNTILYIGRSKEWCLKNSSSWGSTILQNVEGIVFDGVLRYTGTVRKYKKVWQEDKFFNLSVVEGLEIDSAQYTTKETYFSKKKYIKMNSGKYLYKEPKGKREITVSNFKLNNAGV